MQIFQAQKVRDLTFSNRFKAENNILKALLCNVNNVNGCLQIKQQNYRL